MVRATEPELNGKLSTDHLSSCLNHLGNLQIHPKILLYLHNQ
jgi:hypothetical protein